MNKKGQVMPVILICCPNVIQGKVCNCGFNNYINANDSKDIADQVKNQGTRDGFTGEDSGDS